jgi:hypothetical protein
MWRFFLGLLMVLGGGAIMYYARMFEKWFGSIRWAEENLWWTAQLYSLVGFVVVILWFMLMFGFVKY